MNEGRRDKLGDYADFMDDVIFFMHQTRERMIDMHNKITKLEEIVEELAELPKPRIKEEPL